MKIWDLVGAVKGGSRLFASGPVAKIQDGAMEHRQGLEIRYKAALERWSPLLHKLAASVPPGMDSDDVFQEASVALLKTVLLGDPDRGGEDAMARRAVQNAVIDLFRRATASARMPRSPDGSGTFSPPVHLSTTNPGIADDAMNPEDRAILEQELDTVLARCDVVRSGLNAMDRVVLDTMLSGNSGQKASGLTRGSHRKSLRRIRGRFRRMER